VIVRSVFHAIVNGELHSDKVNRENDFYFLAL
jgi:hypothetical protein